MALEPCKIAVHNPTEGPDASWLARYTPTNWIHNQYAVELWLQRSLANHPWVVRNASNADAIVIAANFSMMCVAGKGQHSARVLWKAMLADANALGGVGGAPKIVLLQYNGCTQPWTGSSLPKDVLILREFAPDKPSKRARTIVTPFVVSKPPWLVGSAAAGAPAAVPWDERELLFFAGHIPKLYIRPTRYQIWRQLRRVPNVTLLSSTLYCGYGPFDTCAAVCRPSTAPRRCGSRCRTPPPYESCEPKTNEYWTSFCHPFCGNKSTCGGMSMRREEEGNRAAFLRNCNKYLGVNFTAELGDMRRDTRRLSHAAYLRQAMTSKFCLIAPGDWPSTHKVTEALALGGAGGCLPVFVVPGKTRKAVAPSLGTMLPYTRWLDYCSVSYLISEHAARTDLGPALRRLAAVTAAEAAAKAAALRAVHAAFTFRAGSSVGAPSAAEYVLGDICAAARRFRATGDATSALAGGDLASCTLG